MTTDDAAEITQLLQRWSSGDLQAREAVMPLVFDEIRDIARHFLEGEAVDHTLQPTAVVHELYMKLVSRRSVHWNNREHFFGTAANLIRCLLVDHARQRLAKKRGGGEKAVPLEEAHYLLNSEPREILALHEALDALESIDRRQHKVVMLRYFVGLTQQEVAKILGTSRATVERDWVLAKMFLRRSLAGFGED